MSLLIASLITLIAPAMWIATLVGLPGNWGMVLLLGILWYFAPESMHIAIDWPAEVSILSLAIAGEVVEFFAGAAGAKQQGASKRGTALAVLGSIVGSIAGMFIGVPVPIIGSLIAAVIFGGVGAYCGAVSGELWAGKDWNQSLKIGWGALWGKLLGTLLKTICGTAMLVLLLYAVWY